MSGRGAQASEHGEQVALFRWAELQAARWPELALLHAIPNGGKRDRITAARLKAEGVKAGVPDLFLPVARCGYNGLYIELKTRSGRTSEAQRQWLSRLSRQGYFTAVCRGWHPASQLLAAYLRGRVDNFAKEATHDPSRQNRQRRAGPRVHRPGQRRRDRAAVG